jgi:hypothetical protein
VAIVTPRLASPFLSSPCNLSSLLQNLVKSPENGQKWDGTVLPARYTKDGGSWKSKYLLGQVKKETVLFRKLGISVGAEVDLRGKRFVG